MLDSELSRRQLLVRSAATAAGLSLSMSMLAAERAQALVDPVPDKTADNTLLNTLLVAERNAIATYAKGADVINADTTTDAAVKNLVLAVATHFSSQHKDHADALAKLITDNGGTPSTNPGAPSIPTSFPATAKTPEVVQLAADKEKAAAFTYTQVMQNISTAAAATLVSAIGAVETQHFIVLYLLAEKLISTTTTTLANVNLVVPSSFILNVGLPGTSHLDDPALEAALAYDVKP